MKERVSDEKLLIISVAVRGINDHIRFCDYDNRCFNFPTAATPATDCLPGLLTAEYRELLEMSAKED